MYRVQIRCEGGTWVVNRRYNQFKMLNDCLAKSITLPAVLPPRKLTGNLDAEFISQRRLASPTFSSSASLPPNSCCLSDANAPDGTASAALEAYLQAIVRDTVVINAKEFRAFIDSNLDASSRYHRSPSF